MTNQLRFKTGDIIFTKCENGKSRVRLITYVEFPEGGRDITYVTSDGEMFTPAGISHYFKIAEAVYDPLTGEIKAFPKPEPPQDADDETDSAYKADMALCRLEAIREMIFRLEPGFFMEQRNAAEVRTGIDCLLKDIVHDLRQAVEGLKP